MTKFQKINIAVGDRKESIVSNFSKQAIKAGYAESDVRALTDQALAIGDYNDFLGLLFSQVKNTAGTHLQVWWNPQVGSKVKEVFEVPVKSFEEAQLIYITLSNYDLFQFNNGIKPDYTNMGGLQYWNEENQVWLEYADEDGYSFSEIIRMQN